MTNLQLIDTVEGGHFVFKGNDYLLDEGVYSEMYCALFSTKSAEWIGDNAFNIEGVKVSSKTENAIAIYSTFTDANINLIRKAVENDLSRFVSKNPFIQISGLSITFESKNRLVIEIQTSGNSDIYSFIVDKTAISLENINEISDCETKIKVISVGNNTLLGGGGESVIGW